MNLSTQDGGHRLFTKHNDPHVIAFFVFSLPASLSLCCNPLTSAQLMIQPVPQYAAEGESILLQVYNLPEDLQAFSWYKSIYRGQVLKIVEYSNIIYPASWEPAYRDRGMVYSNGSLLLENVTKQDAGMYALAVLNEDFKLEEAYVKIYVNSK